MKENLSAERCWFDQCILGIVLGSSMTMWGDLCGYVYGNV